VQEVDTAKGTSDKRVDLVTGTLEPDLSATTDVGEDVTFSHLDESQLGVVAVSKEIWNETLADVSI
jgi:hypothetical protein